ncbi:MAG: hypothetical protein Q7V88_00665 [Actinomycetota bacterium]|nr:hypothetical protein [Actinomycetota bacterium]
MLTNADELRHADVAVEAWWWWGWTPAADAGLFVGFEVRGRRFDYWAGLVRTDHPYLYVEELDGTGLREGLEIKPPEMWAGHTCDVPFRQWSLGNEAHGVLLDPPSDALRRPYGTPAPTTFDVEWYAAGDATVIPHGYQQAGEVDARVELAEGVVEFSGPAHRVHVWGVPYLPATLAMPAGDELPWAPYRRHTGVGVLQVLTRQGFLARTVEAP